MIKPFTCVCMLLAAGSGLYLYQTKHRSQMLDREIGRTLKQTDLARDRIGVLKGDWAMLTEPERLAELSQQHLSLRTLSPTQFTTMADLGNRLPAPMPPSHAAPAAEELDAVPLPPPVPVAAAVKPTRMASVAAPAPVAPPIAAPRPAPSVAANPAPAPAPVQVAALPVPPVGAAVPRTRAVAVPAPAVQVAAASAPVPPPVPAARTVVPASGMVPPGPRLLAPIVSVSAAPMVVPPAVPARVQGLAVRPAAVVAPGIGESVARAGRVPVAAGSALAYGNGVIPAAAPVVSGGYQAPAVTSALGGVGRSALPAPVPYGTAAR